MIPVVAHLSTRKSFVGPEMPDSTVVFLRIPFRGPAVLERILVPIYQIAYEVFSEIGSGYSSDGDHRPVLQLFG